MILKELKWVRFTF